MPMLEEDVLYEESIMKKIGLEYAGLVWCELGNMSYAGGSAKEMYQKKGVNHTSIDLNGLHNSVPMDLDKPVPADFENRFDVVSNYGTSEHVGNQYSVFRNIHVMGKVGAIMFHGLSLVGNWPRHCRYYYSKQFFESLSACCHYTVIDLTILDTGFYRFPRNAIIGALRKDQACQFPSPAEFAAIPGMVDTGNVVKTGNYGALKKAAKKKK